MVVKLTDYNLWANTIICGYIKNAAEIADVPMASSFPTIRKTMYHIWDAQLIWLSRLNGTPFTSWPSKDFTGSLNEACEEFIENCKDFKTYAENCNGNFSNRLKYHTLDGTEYNSAIEEMIVHCMNHGTYHRGQLITMLRQGGFMEVGSTDFIRFCRISQ
jgi:uncharacterized damage-inducible protein DinB